MKFSVRNCITDPNTSGVTPGDFDNVVYPEMRGFIRDFVCDSLNTIGIAKDTRVLHVAPQTHFELEGCSPDTLDIDPTSNPTYVADITNTNDSLIHTGTYDVVVCTEVLEHTCDPFAATRELKRVLKIGGALVMTVPCNFRIHGPLPDGWRFTEHGLRQLATRYGFDVKAMKCLEIADRPLFPIDYGVIFISKGNDA